MVTSQEFSPETRSTLWRHLTPEPDVNILNNLLICNRLHSAGIIRHALGFEPCSCSVLIWGLKPRIRGIPAIRSLEPILLFWRKYPVISQRRQRVSGVFSHSVLSMRTQNAALGISWTDYYGFGINPFYDTFPDVLGRGLSVVGGAALLFPSAYSHMPKDYCSIMTGLLQYRENMQTSRKAHLSLISSQSKRKHMLGLGLKTRAHRQRLVSKHQ